MKAKASIEHVIDVEGGYVLTNRESDRGGETYAGISRRHNSKLALWEMLDDRGGDDPLVREEARQVYYSHYWEPLRCDELLPFAAELMFNAAVNCGVGTAARWAQSAAGAEADGIIGVNSISAINASDPEEFRERFCVSWGAHYGRLVRKHPDQLANIVGWISRLIHAAHRGMVWGGIEENLTRAGDVS